MEFLFTRIFLLSEMASLSPGVGEKGEIPLHGLSQDIGECYAPEARAGGGGGGEWGLD